MVAQVLPDIVVSETWFVSTPRVDLFLRSHISQAQGNINQNANLNTYFLQTPNILSMVILTRHIHFELLLGEHEIRESVQGMIQRFSYIRLNKPKDIIFTLGALCSLD